MNTDILLPVLQPQPEAYAARRVDRAFDDVVKTLVLLREALTALPPLFSGAGDPETAVVGEVGSMYLRTDGGTGTTLYVKETGSGATGWVAK